jgi:2-keto-4-pentenoate hydratase/2-oxohepta-3-ene-1,7-dioic acid hydratase in catechol pathway
VGKILAVARNYPAHAQEMGSSLPERPVFFLKPASSVVLDGGEVVLPPRSREVHSEVELAAVIGTAGTRIEPPRAADHILGYAVGLDMTARDLQKRAMEGGMPWTESKGYDTFAPLSEVIPREEAGDPADLVITLRVNGELRQSSQVAKMHFPPEALISAASEIMTLERGDVLMTGTPEGVGRVSSGDVLEAELEGLARLTVRVR